MVHLIKKTLIGVVLVYLCVLLTLFLIQRDLLYNPENWVETDISALAQDSYELVRVQTDDGLALDGLYLPPRDPNMLVLVFFHGNTGDYSDRLYKVADVHKAGYGVLMTEYRGFGGMAGKPTEQGLYRDARAFMGWLDNERGVARAQMVLYGESLGSGVATQMASEYDIGGLILEGAFDSAVSAAAQTYFYVPVGLLMLDQYRSVDKISVAGAPLLQLHGAHDQVIPIALGRALFAAAQEPKTFVEFERGTHNTLYDYGAQLHILQFLRTIEGR